MINETDIIRKRYDRLAPYFDRIESMMEKMMMGELRASIWQKVQQARHATSRNSGTPVTLIRSPTQRMGDALNALRP